VLSLAVRRPEVQPVSLEDKPALEQPRHNAAAY